VPTLWTLRGKRSTRGHRTEHTRAGLMTRGFFGLHRVNAGPGLVAARPNPSWTLRGGALPERWCATVPVQLARQGAVYDQVSVHRICTEVAVALCSRSQLIAG
jgi:hypothetical protein